MEKKESAIPKKRLIIAGALFVSAAAGYITAHFASGFADFYGFTVYPVIETVFAHITGIFPFAVGEFMLFLAVLCVLFGIVFFVVNMIKKKGRRLRFLFSSFATVLLVISALLFDFVYAMGINYSRKPFSEIAGLRTEKYTKEQVLEVLTYTIANVTEAGKHIELDSEGHIVLPDDLSARSASAMKKLGQTYGSLDSYYPGVKPVLLLSELMCWGHITGIFSFFSMEADYNNLDIPEELGHTACHELSHLTGFMREDEANYIAFLACRDSGDPYLTYSGWYDMMIHMLNAYYTDATMDEYIAAYSLMPDYTMRQLEMQNEFWDRYESDFGDAAEAINDIYLKINKQSDGTKSYGRVVDLMIADYYRNKADRDAARLR